MEKLDEIYTHLCNTPSDINEYLPTLKKYSEECEHITEMGVRWIVSTYAFLAAKPNKLISIDIKHPDSYGGDLNKASNVAKENNIDFHFTLGDTLDINIEQTDLLFIDTWHAYDQLKKELNRHHSKVNKYIILHDTTLFAFKDEDTYASWGWVGSGRGIWPAVEEFLEENKEWTILERHTTDPGLTVLKKSI
jgi:hypothetical protein